jgi:hypothetical protein
MPEIAVRLMPEIAVRLMPEIAVRLMPEMVQISVFDGMTVINTV